MKKVLTGAMAVHSRRGAGSAMGGGNPPPSKYCRPDHYDGVVLIWKEAGAKAELSKDK